MIGEVAASMRRRWYVVVVIVGLSAALAWTMTEAGGTYYSKTIVWFTADSAPTLLPDNGAENSDVIAFAGAVASELNRGRPPANYASSEAPYYGAGVRQGVLIALRDMGGQWSSWYNAAVIELHIVGRTEAWVADQQEALIANIDEYVRERVGGDDSSQAITVAVEPLTREISHVAASRLQRVMAYAALGLAGVLTSGVAVTLVERVLRRRQFVTVADTDTEVYVAPAGRAVAEKQEAGA